MIGNIPWRGSYILKAECRSYETAFANLRVRRYETFKTADDILLHKQPIQLDEVEVIGSKVMMVNRGDTIIYNASAFQQSYGSMLDELIKQLPGVELHSGGVITVNGQFVSSLLVNGRDFFKGDPKIALDNLPAYYVDAVKVYRKEDDMIRMVINDSIMASFRQKPLIMDVILKRDYAEGWIGNAEAGYGAEERYLARFFGMRYTTHSGLFLYGNLNNVNNAQTANNSGDWEGVDVTNGVLGTQSYGLNFTGSDKYTQMEYDTSLKLTIDKQEQKEISSADMYYAQGNTYLRNQLEGSNKRTSLYWQGSCKYPKPGKFSFQIEPFLSYSKSSRHGKNNSATFLHDPSDSYLGATIDSLFSPIGSPRLSKMLISMRRQQNLEDADDFTFRGMATSLINVYGRPLRISFNGNYNYRDRHICELDQLQYNRNNIDDVVQNKYSVLPDRNYQYKADISYLLMNMYGQTRRQAVSLEFTYGYQQQYSSGERQLYRLDQYSNYRNTLDVLPSSVDSMQAVIDIRNSYSTCVFKRLHDCELHFKWISSALGQIDLSVPVTLSSERLRDYRNHQWNQIDRNKPTVSSKLVYTKYKIEKMEFGVEYEFCSYLPAISYLLDVRDDSDPLNIFVGNADLKNIHAHNFTLDYHWMENDRQQSFNTTINYHVTNNAISQSRLYDTMTGVYTIRPENVDGNWKIWGETSFGQQVDKKKHLSLTTSMTYGYTHSVDYSGLISHEIDEMPSVLSIVNSFQLGGTLRGNYRRKDWHADAIAHMDWSNVRSSALSSPKQNFFQYHYGMTMTKSLTNNIDFKTELTMWSRRGFIDTTMNDDQLLFNLLLTYSFGKIKQWIIKMEGHDILKQVNSVRTVMNAQGRTETWYKTIPSYWMLRLQYQFKKPPKKR